MHARSKEWASAFKPRCRDRTRRPGRMLQESIDFVKIGERNGQMGGATAKFDFFDF
jgi:hypothetical protein